METLLRSLREGGIIAVSDEDLPDLGQTIKMVVTCWIPFQIAQAPATRITKPLLYQGAAVSYTHLDVYKRQTLRIW